MCVKQFWMVLLVCLGLQAVAPGQEKAATPTNELAATTERGRALFAYDQAAWHGTDAIFALKPDTKGLAHYICVKTPTGWLVTFPKWNEAHDRLVVVYEARETAGKFVERKLDSPSPSKDDLVAKERALELAIGDFGKATRPFNSAILPAPGGNLFVYLYPGQTKADVWPIGGDVRYTISADGRHIVEKRQMHKAILDLEVKTNQHAGFHADESSDTPEDTDVLYVLNRKPSMPEFVATARQLYVIDKDGNIDAGKN
jgi:hypothetical protein